MKISEVKPMVPWVELHREVGGHRAADHHQWVESHLREVHEDIAKTMEVESLEEGETETEEATTMTRGSRVMVEIEAETEMEVRAGGVMAREGRGEREIEATAKAANAGSERSVVERIRTTLSRHQNFGCSQINREEDLVAH